MIWAGIEAVFQALASCIAVGFAYSAAARGINVDALEVSLEGDLDLRAFLGPSEEVRPGYKGIRMSYRVKSNAPHEEIVALCDYVQKTSPVLDIIRNPVPVSVTLENGDGARKRLADREVSTVGGPGSAACGCGPGPRYSA